jgi:C4-type Zn-finger protein
MHILDIPHFKEMIIMSTTCDECGYKSNEVKAGGPVSEKGKRIILKIEDAEDMSRDILKVKIMKAFIFFVAHKKFKKLGFTHGHMLFSLSC